MEDANGLLLELLKEHPMYATFIFVSLDQFNPKLQQAEQYKERLHQLKDYFLGINDVDLMNSPSVVLSKIRLLKDLKKNRRCISSFRRLDEKPRSVRCS